MLSIHRHIFPFVQESVHLLASSRKERSIFLRKEKALLTMLTGGFTPKLCQEQVYKSVVPLERLFGKESTQRLFPSLLRSLRLQTETEIWT